MKSVLIILLATFAISAVAQNKPAANQQPQSNQQAQPTAQEQQMLELLHRQLITHYVRKYSVAVQFNDMEVAKDALYDILLENPGNDSLLYNLGNIYYDNQKFPSAALVAQALLGRDPKNVAALELSASSFESLNVMDKALANYETLYLVTSAPFVLYKMAFLQYQLKRYPEALTNIDIFLSKKEADEIKVTYNNKDGNPVDYKARVAMLNLKGLVKQDTNDLVAAKKHFQEALALAPDFEPARQNVAKIK